MHPEIPVFFDAIIKTFRFPSFSEKDEGDRLSEIVKLQATCPNCVHDRGIVDDACRNAKRSCAEDDIGVGSCADETDQSN